MIGFITLKQIEDSPLFLPLKSLGHLRLSQGLIDYFQSKGFFFQNDIATKDKLYNFITGEIHIRKVLHNFRSLQRFIHNKYQWVEIISIFR